MPFLRVDGGHETGKTASSTVASVTTLKKKFTTAKELAGDPRVRPARDAKNPGSARRHRPGVSGRSCGAYTAAMASISIVAPLYNEYTPMTVLADGSGTCTIRLRVSRQIASFS